MLNAVEIIAKKRDNQQLSKEEIIFMIEGYTNSSIPDYQMSAFLMAIYLKGMSNEEATILAISMRDSGDVFDLSDIRGIKVDKHSTGGVGDKVTLILGPLLAYHGAKFAKMSGRGLGHSGGTIDKLESIEGYQTELGIEEFKKQVNEIGLAIVGQSGHIAPADKKIYALRDVTATVASIPLIAASIMSKKLASGADAICLDVKVGSGAFMKDVAQASELATLMVNIGKLANKKMCAIITNMDEPLGHKIGNSLEVYEAIQTLKGKGPQDLSEVVLIIGAKLLKMADLAKDEKSAYNDLKDTLENGLALNKLKELIIAQQGNPIVVDYPEKLLENSLKIEYVAKKDGYISKFNTENVGVAANRLGAGRNTKDDILNLFVGIDLHKKIGDEVRKDEIIATIYTDENQKGLADCEKILDNAIIINKTFEKTELILKIID